MTDCEWPNDNDIDELIDKAAAEFRELIISEYLFEDAVDEFEVFFNQARTKLAVDAYAFITLSPPKIWDSYHAVGTAAGETFVGELGSAINAVRVSIADWEGPAADAFSNHVSHLQTFVDFQSQYVHEVLQRLAAAYKLAVQARDDYKTLIERWVHACQEYRSSKNKQDLAVELKVGAGIIASVVSAAAAPEVVAAGLAAGAGAIGVGVEAFTGRHLGGSNAGEICESYQRECNFLHQGCENEIEQLRRFIVDRANAISGEQPQICEPLPAICDVDGPNFQYENFFHDFTPPGGYSCQVEVERRKYIAEKQGSGESVISRVLSASAEPGASNG